MNHAESPGNHAEPPEDNDESLVNHAESPVDYVSFLRTTQSLPMDMQRPLWTIQIPCGPVELLANHGESPANSSGSGEPGRVPCGLYRSAVDHLSYLRTMENPPRTLQALVNHAESPVNHAQSPVNHAEPL